ncbi:ArsB/NhaD family transporter [Paenibacillus wulumuqiensis]|uniref:SLC13 family permease n=1 Tax=Paenibacillus wulumuqiensis TaxID=1567107 RepID=UPI00138E1D73|nr:SLC13 family permease [Paenibacillus wulumuqiensis]
MQIPEMLTWQPTAAIVIFLIIYAIWMTDQLNRAMIAVIGAVLFLLLGLVQWKNAYTMHINWDTLLLWMSMLVIAGVISRSGLVHYAAVHSLKWTRSNPLAIFIVLMLWTALGAALLDHITIIILMVPLILTITNLLKMHPASFLIAAVITSNIGGTATLIGNPANIWIGTANPQLTFVSFVTVLGPLMLLLLAVNLLLIVLLYWKSFRTAWHTGSTIKLEQKMKSSIENRKLAFVVLMVFVLVIAGLIIGSWLDMRLSLVAAAGAVLMLLAAISLGAKPLSVLRHLEWDTLLFFAGLFVLAGGLVETGWIQVGARYLIELTNGSMSWIALILLWITGLLSAVMDHMPWIAVMIPMVQETAMQMDASTPAVINPLWWALSIGAGVGGSGTLLGSAAGLIAASMADRRQQRLGYLEFLRVGLPLTLISLGIASWYLYAILL